MKPRLDLTEIFQNRQGEKHLVILHEFPDPDAISSAYAHWLISAAHKIDVDIVYKGEISHPQNIALTKLVGVNMCEYKPNTDLSRYQAAVFIDNQGTTVEEIVSALENAQVPVLLVVDHHQPQDRLVPLYNEIAQTGSTSTIYANMLEQGVIEFDSALKEHSMAATALMHGIMSDTEGFVRATSQDFQAAAFLSRFRDAEMLSQILRQARRKQTMDIIHRALGNRVIIENYSIAGISYIRSEDRDAIPQAADFLITEENVHTAIVFGIMSDGDKQENLVGSMRTSKVTLDPDEFLKDVFGKSENGRYYGGGRPLAGGFVIPIGFLSGGPNHDHQQRKWEVFDEQVKDKIFAKIGVER
ncbi:MAG: exopolyphosphatase-like protein [Chloroflexi bacterium RBG_16_54_18]|nr:MAG: exopolyphosphatase-like protein [Chloroflexi bacterium RBG_16_54_18]